MSANTITLNVTSSVSTGATTGFFTIPGDFTSLFYPGFVFDLYSATVAPFPETLTYTTVSSSLVNGNTQVNVTNAVYGVTGSIVSISSATPGTGPFVSGTYSGVSLVGGHGTGAQATVVIAGPGPINTLGAITAGSGYTSATYNAVPLVAYGPIATLGTVTGGTGYVSGTYANVPLTGGSGTGAVATVVVTGGVVTSLTVTTAGTGYIVGDTLSASAASLGGTGSGFSVPVATITGGSLGTGALATVVVTAGLVSSVTITTAGTGYSPNDSLTATVAHLGGTGSGFSVLVANVIGTIQSVTLSNAGVSYQVNDVLTFAGVGLGTGNTVTVTAVTSTETGTIKLQNTQPMFDVGQVVYAITSGNAACQTPWWSTVATVPSIPAVQSATVLGITVAYTNSTTSPAITYSLRLGSSPGVTLLDQSVVFIDKPTAIAAYEAMTL